MAPTTRATTTSPSTTSTPREPSRLPVLEVLGVIATFRQNVERFKLYRASLSVIRFLLVLNLTYTVLGVAFLIMAFAKDLTPEFSNDQRSQFGRIGLMVCSCAPAAAMCDVLALRGLRQWRRGYLLPWLVYYFILVALVFSTTISGLCHSGIKWKYLILILCVMCFFSAWRHVRRQYSEMAFERPTCRTIEELAVDMRATGCSPATAEAPANDLPPKYEDLEQPPAYHEMSNETSQDSPSRDSRA